MPSKPFLDAIAESCFSSLQQKLSPSRVSELIKLLGKVNYLLLRPNSYLLVTCHLSDFMLNIFSPYSLR
ncbi:hypothetical protein HPG69_003473 [Diceros bicornis minor]|uniref:Uncharacterized protein n=1 Tax=Diceros bicornis minor TaxID=77932 RepID=A0A7J7E923_DICBM|nr:hypothetical protein HPG69_003473 [Diceros bicornis minor]